MKAVAPFFSLSLLSANCVIIQKLISAVRNVPIINDIRLFSLADLVYIVVVRLLFPAFLPLFSPSFCPLAERNWRGLYKINESRSFIRSYDLIWHKNSFCFGICWLVLSHRKKTNCCIEKLISVCSPASKSELINPATFPHTFVGSRFIDLFFFLHLTIFGTWP